MWRLTYILLIFPENCIFENEEIFGPSATDNVTICVFVVLLLLLQIVGANGSLTGSETDPHNKDISIDLSAVAAAYKKKKQVTHHELLQSLSAPYRWVQVVRLKDTAGILLFLPDFYAIVGLICD